MSVHYTLRRGTAQTVIEWIDPARWEKGSAKFPASASYVRLSSRFRARRSSGPSGRRPSIILEEVDEVPVSPSCPDCVPGVWPPRSARVHRRVHRTGGDARLELG